MVNTVDTNVTVSVVKLPLGAGSVVGPVGMLGVLWYQWEVWECYGSSGNAVSALVPVGML